MCVYIMALRFSIIPQGDYTYINDQPIQKILQYNSVSQNPVTFDDKQSLEENKI